MSTFEGVDGVVYMRVEATLMTNHLGNHHFSVVVALEAPFQEEDVLCDQVDLQAEHAICNKCLAYGKEYI